MNINVFNLYRYWVIFLFLALLGRILGGTRLAEILFCSGIFVHMLFLWLIK